MDCVNIKTTSEAIRAIGDLIRNGSNWQDALKGIADDSATILKNKVQEFIANLEKIVGMSITDYVGASVANRRSFARTWKSIEQSLLNEFQDKAPNKYAEIDKTTNDIKLEFGSEDTSGYDRVSKNFTKAIVDSSIFHIELDGTKIVSISSVLSGSLARQDDQLNRNIHAFKLRLLQDIGAYVDININPDYGLNDSAFTDMIVQALTLFENKYSKDLSESDTKKAAHDAYVTLKYFDVFMSDLKFIETKPAYKKSAGYSTNMYTYVGQISNPPSHWGKDEIQNAARVNSPLLSLIFDNMPEVKQVGDSYELKQPADKTQVMVTSNAFMNIMAKFKEWMFSQGKTEDIANLNASELLTNLKEYLAKHFIPDEGFNKFATRYPDKLRGIIAVLDSQIDEKTLNSIWKNVITNEAMSYSMYSNKSGRIHRQEGKQKLISLQEIRILDRIKNAVFEFGTLNSDAYKNLCATYGIKVNGKTISLFVSEDNPDGIVHLTLNSNNQIDLYYLRGGQWISDTKEFTTSVDGKQIKIPELDIDAMNDRVKPMIETLLGQIPDGWQQYTSTKDLLDLFGQALGCTILAIDGHNPNLFQFDRIGSDKVKYLKTSTAPFKNKLQSLAEMFAAAYGADVTITLKNLNGDSIPAFSLTAWIHGMKRTRNKLAKESDESGVANAFETNFVYQNYLKIGEPIVRRDTQIGRVNTQSTAYTENEVTYLGIVCDFFESLYDKNNQFIHFQNTTNSDKGTHWIIPYGKDIVVGVSEGEEITLGNALQNIIAGKNVEENIGFLLNTMYDCRRGEYLNIATNLINDYNQVFGWSLSTDPDDILESIEAINDFLNEGNFGEFKSAEAAFKAKGVEFVNELHTAKNGLFNPALLDELRLYCSQNPALFERRINKQLDFFVQDLINQGFELNFFDDANISDLLRKMPNNGSGWLDTKTGDVIFKKDNNYNPLLIAYFLADVLCSTEYNKMMDGFYWAHNGKYEPSLSDGDYETTSGNPSTGEEGEKLRLIDGSEATIIKGVPTQVIDGQKKEVELNQLRFHENYFIHDAAKRLAASYKRTVINGASIECYVPQEFGIGPEFIFAAVKDIPGTVWNMMGEQNKKLDSMDGSAFVHPVFAILAGWSSPTGKVTYDNKTICGDIGAKFGIPTLFKWAEFGLTNHRRQMGNLSDASAEHLFELMSSIPIGQYIRLEDYYGYSRNSANKTIHNLGDFTPLYKKDPFTGKTYLISDISTNPTSVLDQNGNSIIITECNYSLTEVDKTGRVIGKATRESREIRNIYDIDQVFGGAWCMKLGENGLEDYNANNLLLADLVCREGLKDKLIAYIVNNSAMKVGNRNVNDSSIFDHSFGRDSSGRIDSSKLLTSVCSSYNLGKQMDPDHELEFAEVSEMSQMISALIQGGHFTSLVKRIYQEIGKVAAQEMRLTQEALDKNDPDKIYQLLGESLMEAFETGNRNTTGLAQSFLIKAKKSLNDHNIEYEIPFSAPTINATFISDVVASINKKGIRRKYSGIASVLIPSHNMIQLYNHNGKNMMFREFAQQVIKDYPRRDVSPSETNEESITKNREHVYRLINDFEYAFENGAIVEYSPGEKPDSEDTVVIVSSNEDGTTSTEVVKIDNIDDFDRVRHLLPATSKVYKWTVKPRNLRQADVTFKRVLPDGSLSRDTFSMYDLDSNRALHYLRQLEESRKHRNVNPLTDPLKVQTLRIALFHAGIDWDGVSPVPKDLSQWKRLLNIQLRHDLAALDTTGEIFTQTAMIGQLLNESDFERLKQSKIKVGNVNTRYAEMIMGRLHAEELGLRSGDDINLIKQLKDEFFLNRLVEKQTISSAKNVYDYAVTTSTGHTIYVAIRNNHSKADLAPYRVANKSFTQEDTGIWYNHTEKISDFISPNCSVVSIQNDAKEVCPFIIVDSEDDALKFINGEGIDFVHYNITSNNFKQVIYSAFGTQLDSGIILAKPNRHYPEGLTLTKQLVDNFDSLTKEDQERYISKVKSELEKRNSSKMKKLAHKQWLAFQEQLYYVGARIPTQSMQSFQALELVGFSDSLKNEVYVPKVQTWLQGSDYDVDKLYIMSYYLSKNGVLPTFSKLEDELELKSLKPLLRLESPNGRTYSELQIDLHTLNNGTHYLLDGIAIEKQAIDGQNGSYKVFSTENPESYIEIINDSGTDVFTITTSNIESIKDAIKLLKPFIELSPEGSIFNSDGSTLNDNIIAGLLRGDHCISVNGIITKNPNLNPEYCVHISKQQVLLANNLVDFDCFNNIMQSKSNFITFDNDVTEEQKVYFLKLLNKHTQGKPNFTFDWEHGEGSNISDSEIEKIINNDYNVIRELEHSNRYNLRFAENVPIETISKVMSAINDYRKNTVKIPNKEHALQNSVLGGILNLLDKRTIQPYGHNPITTDNLKSLIGKDEVEMRMSMDNPFVKFMMQVQNMVGKEVIGITAVSMKVFFAASTYFNSELDSAIEAYKNCDDSEFGRHLLNILFVDHTSEVPELNTMANLNLLPLQQILDKLGQKGDILISIKDIASKTEFNRLRPALAPYLKNGKLSLKALLYGGPRVKGIIQKSQTQDAAQNISELLSAATDNAKELILAKINATSEFADIWGALLMTGHSFDEVNSIMQSPFFNTIAKLCKGFEMSSLHKGINVKNIIKFMNLNGNIPSINSKALRYAIGAFPSTGLNNCFYYKMFYETNDQGQLLMIKNGKKVPIDANAKKEDLIKRTTPLYFYKPDQNGNLQKVTVNAEYISKLEVDNSQTRKEDMQFWLTSPVVVDEFEKHLISLLPNLSHSEILSGIRKAVSDSEEDYDPSEEFFSSEEQDFEFEDDWDSIPEDTLTGGTTEDYRLLLRYTRKFLKQRAKVLSDNLDQFGKFKRIVDKVLPITEEQNIAGMELGVNQGMPTNEFDFYNKLYRIENFVNKAYSNNNLEQDFDVISFIEDDAYREYHIQKYESIKNAINPLAVISKVPNFAQMFKFYGVANSLLSRSSQFKLDFLLAKQILKNDNTKRLNADEFKALHNTIKDSLILSWLKQSNLTITLPKNQLIYLPKMHGGIETYYTPVSGLKIDLGSIENLATFKHLMDTYVFPKLKSDPRFADNEFVRIIDSTVKINSLHQQLELRKRMPLDMMKVDESITSKDMFNSIVKAFGKIAGDTQFLKELGISNGSLTLGDLIYLYNLYVYKDSFSQDSFTRVFEIMNVYNNDALINKYYTWLAKIDRAMSLRSPVADEHFELYTGTGEKLEFDIKYNDILYRMSVLENADKRIGITAIENNGIKKIQPTDSFGNPVGKALDVACKDASDFWMELPFASDSGLSDEEIENMGFNREDIQQRFVPNDTQVLNATMDAIDEVCNLDSELVVEIDNSVLEEWQKNPEKAPFDLTDQSVLRRVSRSHGFIYDGKIYINMSNPNYSASTKLHELSHGVCAMLKYSKDPKQRKQYYELIDAVAKTFTPEQLNQLAKDLGFKTPHSSDFKEELLVDQIAQAFKKGLDKTVFGDTNKFSKNALKARILSAVNQMLGIDVSERIPLEKIGKTDLTTLVALFGEISRDFDSDSLKNNLRLSAEAKAFKQYLMKQSESEFNNSSEGIYYTC